MKTKVVNYLCIVATILFLSKIGNVETASFLSKIGDVETASRKTSFKCAIYFAQRPIGDAYIAELKGIPESVLPQHIMARLIAPDEDGNLTFLDVRVLYRKPVALGIKSAWYVTDFTIRLRTPVPPNTIPFIQKSVKKPSKPAGPNKLIASPKMFNEWKVTVTLPRQYLPNDEEDALDTNDVVEDIMEASTGEEDRYRASSKRASRRYKPLTADAEFSLEGEGELNNPELWKNSVVDLGLVGVAMRPVKPVLRPPLEYQASLPQKAGMIG